ncbi:hypothetical protein C1H46_002887 [Malus baccata]|uniref:Uncharacterized protein n=1 Tax=Malus baccata TaxID=106549 RepID=A0A540NKE2_MALBA|nr:hypothetical protein C1H46_002887 [Malus baccata]
MCIEPFFPFDCTCISMKITLKLGEGLVYEVVDGSNSFPHFYGPSRSFIPLPLDAVTKAEKLHLSGGQFSCSMLERAA